MLGELELNRQCPFKSRPSVGEIVYGSACRGDQISESIANHDKRALETAGRVRLEKAFVYRPKPNIPETHMMYDPILIGQAFRVIEVSDWWDENRPLLEPDFAI